ncbi:MAG: hypothetical protein DI623_12790 [Sphingomonas sanxanigenens]|uniref:Uncharacterized protein n=1 Tax=Sphingomonas sanxanigenens TaxID=397260 RepID=A0A2W5A7E2_9SPHN|nr:MAG: hypothetical protein DI623_12790 [Sphingomonas sanxanigenens]
MLMTNTISPTAERLRTDALCNTASPADAASALMSAAAAILSARFEPPVICALLDAAMREALALDNPVGRA